MLKKKSDGGCLNHAETSNRREYRLFPHRDCNRKHNRGIQKRITILPPRQHVFLLHPPPSTASLFPVHHLATLVSECQSAAPKNNLSPNISMLTVLTTPFYIPLIPLCRTREQTDLAGVQASPSRSGITCCWSPSSQTKLRHINYRWWIILLTCS